MTFWNDSLLVGVAQIDGQHRRLIEAIDRLMTACEDGKEKTEIGKYLVLTADFAKEHLRDEENLQERYSYPGINAHKRLHAQFVLTINGLIKEYERTGPNVAMTAKLDRALVQWLLEHFSTEDKKVGIHIQQATAK